MLGPVSVRYRDRRLPMLPLLFVAGGQHPSGHMLVKNRGPLPAAADGLALTIPALQEAPWGRGHGTKIRGRGRRQTIRAAAIVRDFASGLRECRSRRKAELKRRVPVWR